MKVLRIHDVMARVGLSRPTIYRKVAAGEFPKPVKLGAASVGWLETELNDWISAKASARGEAA